MRSGPKSPAFIVGAIVSLALLAVGASALELHKTAEALSKTRPGPLLVALIAFLALYPIRGIRWSRLISPLANVSPKTSTEVLVIGALANNVLPARLGDVVRAFVLGKSEGVPGAAVLSTVLIERILDGLTVVLALSAVLIFDPPSGAWVHGVGMMTGIIFLAALGVATSIAVFEERAVRLFARLASPFPAALAGKAVGILERLSSGCRALRSPRIVAVSAGLSIVIWTSEALVYALVGKALEISIAPSGWFLMLGILNLGLAAPSLPAFVGVFEGLIVASLSLYGTPTETALAFALVLHVLHFTASSGSGLLAAAKHGLKVRDLQAPRTSPIPTP